MGKRYKSPRYPLFGINNIHTKILSEVIVEIFCDESGFTGNQLLDDQQQVFVYASVAVSSEEANDIVARVRANHRLDATELKGSSLTKQARGRYAVTEVLKALSGRFKYATHLKPYALTSKFFEYVFEPAFAKCNSIYYGIGFHRFISTLLFIYFRAQDLSTAQLLSDFSNFARKGDVNALQKIFPPVLAQYTANPLHAIGLFAELHREAITDEITGFREPGVPNWILDLTLTSIHGLLALWGEEFECLDVTCDESKPLKGDVDFLNLMVGRRETARMNFAGREQPVTFNLCSPIKFARSHNSAGLQLADIVAAASSAVWNTRYDREASASTEEWAPLVSNEAIGNSIWPDLSAADLDTPSAFANSAILLELVERSINGIDLCEGMYELYRAAVQMHPEFMEEKRSVR